MSDILRDPIWQFIGAILAFVAIFISFGLYLRPRRRKAMSYEIVSQTPLLSIEEEVKGKLKILFEEKPVQKVYLIVTKVINSGNLSIIPADYQRPLSFSFGEKARVLTAEVVETNPDNLQASVEIEGKKVVLEPTLLNEKDSITLKMLVSQFGGQIGIDCRIVGVKNIKKFDPIRRARNEVLLGMVLVIVGIFLRSILDVPPLYPGFLVLLGTFVLGMLIVANAVRKL